MEFFRSFILKESWAGSLGFQFLINYEGVVHAECLCFECCNEKRATAKIGMHQAKDIFLMGWLAVFCFCF